ncbi:hypothetical protein WEU32_02830 [Brevundimonas sp. BH3]|uniref:hypothetical protein n=1 Tax=unclassified Brevundimonas TaxID=2622653 RepID=UPI0028A0ABFB|nr:hypothetical protein [Brevundimonas sp.]
MSRFIRPVLAACLVLAPVATVQAQDWRGTPVFGQTRLSGGFTPDPYTVQITAGGTNDAGELGGGRCTGMIGNNPDYALRYSATDMPLYIRTTSDSDTTLVVRDPQGSWQCDDDTNGLNPELSFPRPQSGTYHIWVGTYGNERARATLEISELSDSGTYASGGQIDLSLDSNFGGVTLRSGFRPDPHNIEIVAGGSVPISSVDDSCPGSVSSAPDYSVTYTGNRSAPLVFTFVSDDDAVLLINGPDGEWTCDDDSDGNLDPRVTYRRAQTGTYDIWVGTVGGQMARGTLSVSEIN